MPLCIGNNKSEVFKYLIERSWQKVSNWNQKLLSVAGREVLIKSVLESLPQYVMMCWKLPRSLCKRLSSIINRFWWSDDGSRRIHWMGSSVLTKTKQEGGDEF